MRLRQLLEGICDITLRQSGPDGLTITDISDDTRHLVKGALYVGLPGTKVDGSSFAAQAVAAGAVAILVKEGAVLPSLPADVAVIEARDVRVAVGEVCARFFTPRAKYLSAVTGTDGKTSVAHFTRQLWEKLGHKAASIGTIGVRGNTVPSSIATDNLSNTTPGIVALSRLLQTLGQAQVHHVVMEASSHGIEQRRVEGMAFQAAAFTNLTRDHLDYHGTVEAYFEAKARLFTEVMAADGVAVLYGDDPHAQVLADKCAARGIRVLTYGQGESCEMRLASYVPTPRGVEVVYHLGNARYPMHLPLIGRFQALNLMAAAGLAYGCGASWEEIMPCLPEMEGVPGRLQNAGYTSGGGAVLVDYAHTPAALENMLRAVREHVAGKLIVVFGCGGDRDAGKRPLMGKAAAEQADVLIVTDDNPRTEDPASIRAAVVAGIPAGAEYEVIGDRAEAIRRAIHRAKAGDVVVIAGKGHEQEQIIGTEKHPFDDVNIAREACGEAV